jgi:hypothetical protein
MGDRSLLSENGMVCVGGGRDATDEWSGGASEVRLTYTRTPGLSGPVTTAPMPFFPLLSPLPLDGQKHRW